jgi:hypothetical protein
MPSRKLRAFPRRRTFATLLDILASANPRFASPGQPLLDADGLPGIGVGTGGIVNEHVGLACGRMQSDRPHRHVDVRIKRTWLINLPGGRQRGRADDGWAGGHRILREWRSSAAQNRKKSEKIRTRRTCVATCRELSYASMTWIRFKGRHTAQCANDLSAPRWGSPSAADVTA